MIYSVSIPSPFSPKQAEIFIKSLSTKFQHREETKHEIAKCIVEVVERTPGNHLVFFPSYHYMQLLVDELEQLDMKAKMIFQDSEMSEKMREGFLSEFQPNPPQTLVGFAVLGGSFSEGIDLKGDRLNSVIVIGVGLPQLCLERSIMKDYFHSIGKNGYNYAYMYPGMNKVLQAGGMLIRSEYDKGKITLIDDRYLTPDYQSMLPIQWMNYNVL